MFLKSRKHFSISFEAFAVGKIGNTLSAEDCEMLGMFKSYHRLSRLIRFATARAKASQTATVFHVFARYSTFLPIVCFT